MLPRNNTLRLLVAHPVPVGRLYLTYANGAGPHPQSVSEPMNSVEPSNPKRLLASTANTYWTQTTQAPTMP